MLASTSDLLPPFASPLLSSPPIMLSFLAVTVFWQAVCGWCCSILCFLLPVSPCSFSCPSRVRPFSFVFEIFRFLRFFVFHTHFCCLVVYKHVCYPPLPSLHTHQHLLSPFFSCFHALSSSTPLLSSFSAIVQSVPLPFFTRFVFALLCVPCCALTVDLYFANCFSLFFSFFQSIVLVFDFSCLFACG